ncbi:MAG: PQQ-binding-like beta-propeller repeat protein [Myxococcales bacterium]|nr:PQQ-binding-like beta-propeller repeat protein [Myxococcales bacterium]
MMRHRTRLLALAAFAAVAGCRWIPLSNDPTTPGRDTSPPAIYAVDWWVPLVAPRLWEYAPREPAAPAIDPDTQRVVVATRDGVVRALSPLDGRVEWEFKTSGGFSAGPLVREGVVYVPGGDGALYALKAATGDQLWRYASGEELGTTPVFASGKLLVASNTDTLYAVDAASGKWSWQYRRDAPSGFTIRGAAAPKVDSGVAFVGFSDGYLVALEVADGAMKWERALGGSAKQFLDVDSTPVLDEAGRVYVASYQQGVYALSPETGEIDWHSPKVGVTGLAIRGEVLYAMGDSQLAALHSRDGRALWSLDLHGRAARLPAFARGMLVVPVGGALLFVDPSTGRAQTAFDPGKGVTATPAKAAPRLYVLSNLGYLYAMRLVGSGG